MAVYGCVLCTCVTLEFIWWWQFKLWGLYGDDNLGSSKSRIWLESMVTSVYLVMTVYMDMTVGQAISIPVGL